MGRVCLKKEGVELKGGGGGGGGGGGEGTGQQPGRSKQARRPKCSRGEVGKIKHSIYFIGRAVRPQTKGRALQLVQRIYPFH